MPQIEVTFDIDANGIVHVAAKDFGTGKEQSIKITASSGLSEEEIKKMVREAEAHAADDKKHKETVEARNQLDSLMYSTEKSLKEYGSDLDAGVKENIESGVKKAKETLEGQDAEAMRKAAEAVKPIVAQIGGSDVRQGFAATSGATSRLKRPTIKVREPAAAKKRTMSLTLTSPR